MLLAHLRAGSIEVGPGDPVTVGQPVARCGNSGNSTQPHLHLQVMDSRDLLGARGLPMAFHDYLAWSRGASVPRKVTVGLIDGWRPMRGASRGGCPGPRARRGRWALRHESGPGWRW